jgi:hypothetical protein
MLAMPAVLWIAVPLQVHAQTAAVSFEELRTLVKAGDTLEIIETSGRKTSGELGGLSAVSLQLLVRQTDSNGRPVFVQQTLLEHDVRLIRRKQRDSLLNGTLIGFGVGVSWMALCAREGCYDNNGLNLPMVGLITGAAGAGIGAVIDAHHIKRTVVYQAPGQRTSAVQVSPFSGKSGTGIQLGVRF